MPDPAPTVSWSQVAALRLERQHFMQRVPADRLLDVVREHIGIQAQVMSLAELHLNARIDGLRPDDVRDHLWTQRRLVKTWAMRVTLPSAARGTLVFGPDRGRNVTFVDPQDWLGKLVRLAGGSSPDPHEALGRLVERFLGLFPGADMPGIGRWWGSRYTMRKAIDAAGLDLVNIDIEGTAGLALRSDVKELSARRPFTGVRLLPGFDAYVNDLPRRVDALMPVDRHEAVHRVAGWVSPVVIVDGRVAGTWELASGKRGGISVQPFSRWRGGVRQEVAAEADRIAAFLDRPLPVSIASSLPPAG